MNISREEPLRERVFSCGGFLFSEVVYIRQLNTSPTDTAGEVFSRRMNKDDKKIRETIDNNGFSYNRAGDGNRTHVSSLEGWCSTIELHPHNA